MQHTRFATVIRGNKPDSPLLIREHKSSKETANCCRLAATGIDKGYVVLPITEISDKDYPEVIQQ